MAFSTRWDGIQAVTTVDGDAFGYLQVASVEGWYVFQQVGLISFADPTVRLTGEIKKIISPNIIRIGFADKPGDNFQDLTAFAAGSTLQAPEQSKSKVNGLDITQAIFEQSPANAQRSLLVDPYGFPKPSSSMIPYAYDAFRVTSVDGSDNPLTIQYFKGGLSGTLVGLMTMVYDVSGNIQSTVFTPQ